MLFRSEFASYNNQITAENPPHYEQVAEGDSICTYNVYDTWVTTTGGLESRASSLASKAEEINSVVDRINSKVADVQTIAVAIQGYIENIQSYIGNYATSTAISTAFLALGRDGVTKANLATSGAAANSRNFLDYDSIKDDEKLTGGLLTFEKQDDGSYLIKKDGESTGYYTTGLAAGLYVNTLLTTLAKENGATQISSYDEEHSNYSTTINNSTEKVGDEMVQKYHEQQAKSTEKAGDEMVQKYHEQQAKSTEKAGDEMVQKYHEQQTQTTEMSDTEFVTNLENKEQYTFDSQIVENDKPFKIYKGQSGGYKLVESMGENDTRVTYYDKNNDYIYSAIFNENGELKW